MASMLPAALTPEELLDRADLAGCARVISVKRNDKGYVARLRFESLTKGSPRVRHRAIAWLPWARTVDVKMRRMKRSPDGKPMPGEWSDGYRAGDTVMTHLTWDDEAGAYTTVSWNAVWQTPHRR